MPIIKARSSSIIDSVDLRGQPTAVTAAAGTSTTQIASTGFVRQAVADLIASAPSVLDTLKELSDALGGDENFATTVTTALAGKVALDGDTMTGFLTLSAAPTDDLHASTKKYVDDAINSQMIYSTDDVDEGTNNLYFTTARARESVSLASDNTSVISYNQTTGVFTYNHPTSDGVLEGTTNLYYTDARVRNAISLTSDDNQILSYGSGVFTFNTPDTDKIVEGAINQYFTTARARNSISNGSNISYDSSTGIISTQAAVWSVNGQTHDVVLDTDDVSEGSTNQYFTNARAASAISLTSNDTNILSYSNGAFTFAKPNTDAISEGSTNLYYTNARVRAAVSASGDISYNDATGDFSYSTPTTDGVNEGGTNLYFTNTRARTAITLMSDNTNVLDYDSSTGTLSFNLGNQTTTDVAEGSNLYFTDARAREAISVTGWSNLSYNDGTGVITISAPTTDDVTEGSINQYFTTSRARDSVSATKVGGDGYFDYNGGTGVFSYTGPDDSDYRTAVSATSATGVTYDSATGVFALASIPNSSLTNSDVTINGTTVSLGGSGSFDTDSVNEGEDNLYFTNGRAAAAISLTSDNTSVLDYNSLTGEFTFSLGSQTTDDVAEGSTNLYYTTARTRADVSAVDAGGDGSFSYDSATGAFTYTGPSASEVRAHLSATSNTGVTYTSSTGVIALSAIPNSSLTNSDVTINGTTISLGGSGSIDTDAISEGTSNLYYTQARFNTALGNKTTTDLTEGTNLYYTQARFDDALADKTTDDVAEGEGNLYYTTARTRADVSGGTGVTYTESTGVFAIGQAVGTTDDVTFNDVTVSGDLTVNGTLTTINSTDLTVTDKNITIADGAADAAAANGAGITVDGANATITYASATDSWNFNKDVSVSGGLSLTGSLSAPTFIGDLTGDVTGTVSDISNHTTDALAEGEDNLYFTNTRAAAAISLDSDKTSVLSYDTASGEFTFALANASTSDIAEGTNLYFTDTRARASISVSDLGGDGSLSYDSASGVISYTGPSASEVRAHLSATSASGVTYNSTTGVIALSAIPNSSLTNSDVTINGATVSLGGSTSFGTDSVTEEDNLYFTDARARSAITLTTSDSSVLDYNSTTGEFSFNLSGLDTSEVTEDPAATTSSGTMYFTNARARSAVSAVDAGGDGSFSYDSATGEFTYTGPSASEVRAHLSATSNTGITYDNGTGVFALASIPNSALTNNSITINGSSIALGGSDTLDTDDISEGANNQYFTQARARTAISLTTSDSSVLSYDSLTGAFTFSLSGIDTDEVTEGTTNLYFTDTRARDAISVTGSLSYNSATGVISYTTPTTDGIDEGSTNQYFTNTRARNAISLTTDNTDALSYNSSTGEFHFTLNSVDSDEIGEGAINQYFTTARARASVNNGANIDYDASTGTISTQAAVWSVNGATHDVVLDTDNIDEGSTNLYFTDARAQGAITLVTDDSSILDYATGTGTFTFVTPTTDAIDEGATNLYYTDERADDRIAAASVRDLSDVDSVQDLQDGYTLVWSSALQKFVPQNVAVTATNLNFTGDGTTTEFNTGVEVTSIDNSQVYINGLIQAPTYSYTLSTVDGETSIVFDAAPEANDYIMVRVSATSSLTAGGVLNESSNIDGGTY